MNIQKQTFFHVSDKLNWEKNNTYFVGKELSGRYQNLMSRGFFNTQSNGAQLPMNNIVEGMVHYINTQQKPPFIPETYHFDGNKTLVEIFPMLRIQLVLIRELIFEEVRKEFFPQKLSRYKGLHVIPADKESLLFWLEQLKTPKAKIYKLELTGKLHRASNELLGVHSIPSDHTRYNAYKYWLGNEGAEAASDECLFEGIAQVVEIMDGNTVA